MVKLIYLIIGVKKRRKRIGENNFFLNSLSRMIVLEFSIIWCRNNIFLGYLLVI